MNKYLATQILKEDEGFRGHMYFDTEGIPTIGYGFNLRDSEMPEAIAAALLEAKIQEAEQDCLRNLSAWYVLPEKVQTVLVCLAYNMGIHGLLGFRKMIDHMEKAEYQQAGDELLISRWAHQVGPFRAQRMADMIRSS